MPSKLHGDTGPSAYVGTPEESPEDVVARISKYLAKEFQGMSPSDALAALPESDRMKWLNSLSPAEQSALEFDWNFWARPEQRIPKGKWKNWLVVAGRGFGKHLAETTDLFTLNRGWIKWADTRVGDILFDERGNETRILEVHPVCIPEKCYRVRFSDGIYIDASDTHRWATWTRKDYQAYTRTATVERGRYPKDWIRWQKISRQGPQLPKWKFAAIKKLRNSGLSYWDVRKKINVKRSTVERYESLNEYPRYNSTSSIPPGRIKTTEELRKTLYTGNNRRTNHTIPQCAPLKFSTKKLPIAPYTYGCWLADGFKDAARISQCISDYTTLVKAIESDGYVCGAFNKNSFSFAVHGGLYKALRETGLLGKKRILPEYSTASIKQRKEVLAGLLDCDGSASDGTVTFTNTDPCIVDFFCWLLVSLGMHYGRRKKKNYHDGKRGKDIWVVSFSPTFPVFKFPRKNAMLHLEKADFIMRAQRAIVAVEPINPVPMHCISVDSPNESYLVTRDLICTLNTRCSAEWVRHKITSGQCKHIALIGPSASDIRKVMIEDVRTFGSGIMQVFPPNDLPEYYKSRRLLYWPKYNASCSAYSGEEPELLRGPAHDGAWIDEIMRMKKQDAVWDMLQFGLRGAPNAQVVISTTPKATDLMRRLIKMPNTVISSGSTFKNKLLPKDYIQMLLSEYGGTRTGQQELYGLVLDAVEGALWTRQIIDDFRVEPNPETGVYNLPTFQRTVIGVDPQIGRTPDSSRDPNDSSTARRTMTGIVAVSSAAAMRGQPMHAYVRADESINGYPAEWGKAVVRAYHEYNASLVVCEGNQGGKLLEYVIKSIDPSVRVKIVTAKTKKHERAIPIVTKYEQGRVHHVGVFGDLEHEQLTYEPGDEDKKKSPNRMDALVWAIHHLLIEGVRAGAGIAISRRV